VALFWVGFHYVWKDVLNSQITPDIETNLGNLSQYAMHDSLPHTSYLVLQSLWWACCGRQRLQRLLRWLWWAEAAGATEAAEMAVAG
jgi:hypothetical protein